MRHSPVVPKSVTVPMTGDMKPETGKHRCGEKRHKHPVNNEYLFHFPELLISAAKLRHPQGIKR